MTLRTWLSGTRVLHGRRLSLRHGTGQRMLRPQLNRTPMARMTASPTGAVLDLLPQATLDLLPVAVFLTSVPDGRILRCNQRAVELCGGDAGVPDRLCELLHGLAGDTRLPACTEQIAMALQNSGPLRDTDAVLETA